MFNLIMSSLNLYLIDPAVHCACKASLSSHGSRDIVQRRCYKCNRLGHFAHQGCPFLTWEQYESFRYKFKKEGEIVERLPKAQQKTPDESLPGYGSDEEAKSGPGATAVRAGGRGAPLLPRGARGVASRGGHRGVRGAPRPRGGPRGMPPLKKAKPRHKVKKLTAKQKAAEDKMNNLLKNEVASTADEAQIKAWENTVKMDVPTRICKRTGLRVREDLWDAHISSMSAEIMPYMYLGGERNAHNHKELTYRTHVGFVLNASWEVANFFPDQLEYLHLPFQDFKDQRGAMAKELNRTVDFIDRARAHGSRVLVHCVAGISRSSTIVIHYLMRREGWTLEKAYTHVLKRRPIIRPNIGFFTELQRIDQDIHGRISMSMEDYKALEEGLIKVAAFRK